MSGSIDLAACFLDVGSSSLGSAQVTKSRVVRPLKGNVSWVQTVERQVGFYLIGLLGNCK